MLQQEEPDEYIIATNDVHSLREFATASFGYFGLNWEEHTIIDRNLFRPSDLDAIYGNPAKAKAKLGWVYELTFDELVRCLIEEELAHQNIDGNMPFIDG